MPLYSNGSFDGYETYPLNLLQSKIEHRNFKWLYTELEKISPSLFVTEGNECRVDALEAINVNSTHPVTDIETPGFAETRNSVYQIQFPASHISSLSQLKDTLKVNETTFERNFPVT